MLLIVEEVWDCCRFGSAHAFYPTYSGVDVQDWCLIKYNNLKVGHPIMPTGLKKTSSTVAIGFSVSELGPNTFTQGSVDLNLDPLNNEVFVVQAIDLTLGAPDAIAATDTSMLASLTTTSQTAVATLRDANCLGVAANQIRAAGFVDGGVGFSQTPTESPGTVLDYVGIIATNDFFIQIAGQNNAAAHSVSGKMYGYRARADASVYAGLVQSEVLSA